MGSELWLRAGKAMPQEHGEDRKRYRAGLSVLSKLLIQKPRRVVMAFPLEAVLVSASSNTVGE